MLKEETWSVPIQRVRAFFREQADVTEENANVYCHSSCRITLTELKPKGMGVWAAKRLRVRMEGEDADVENIYHRYFIQFLSTGGYNMSKPIPSIDAWLREAKAHESAPLCGMYLTHNGTVRRTAKARVRYGEENTKEVTGMVFSYDAEKVNAVISDACKLEGIYYIRVWLNEGQLKMGDDIMYVLIGGDIRPRVVDALNYLVGRIKDECVVETELN